MRTRIKAETELVKDRCKMKPGKREREAAQEVVKSVAKLGFHLIPMDRQEIAQIITDKATEPKNALLREMLDAYKAPPEVSNKFDWESWVERVEQELKEQV